MKSVQKPVFLFLLLAAPIIYVQAQTQTEIPTILESKELPQWVKDLRRWEIVAFGSIPFAMFTATFAMDMYRWNDANGMDFSDEGRRYAPWPLKSAGAVVMERKQQETVFIVAGSLSVAIAVADQIIHQVKRYKARKRAESLPVGSVIITRKPLFEESSADSAVPDLSDDEQNSVTTDE